MGPKSGFLSSQCFMGLRNFGQSSHNPGLASYEKDPIDENIPCLLVTATCGSKQLPKMIAIIEQDSKCKMQCLGKRSESRIGWGQKNIVFLFYVFIYALMKLLMYVLICFCQYVFRNFVICLHTCSPQAETMRASAWHHKQ